MQFAWLNQVVKKKNKNKKPKQLWNKHFPLPTHFILAIFIEPLLQPSLLMAYQIKEEEKRKGAGI